MVNRICKSALEWLAVAASSAILLGAIVPHAAAQGCAMCYQTAAASGAPGREALRQGILILLLPAVALFFAILAIIYRRRDPVR